ncbi:MAG TPA: PEP-utilizing enzyme, partial [Candidatus Eisenbacteria bacterium]|nr:PEP-utilizing enzyme [Candidatus Eisenbacteria bacterium]
TYSFARMVYEEVYRQFCRLLGVPERTLEEYQPVFANMLGHVRGRVYYDLLNWYRTIALLPGYRLNREFMERMMGVREKLENAPQPPASGNRLADWLRLAGSAFRILVEDVQLATTVPAFFRRVDRALASLEDQDLAAWSAEQAIAVYRRLESELLRNWRTPIVNDFSAMIWFGVLCRLAERWLPGLSASVVNDLLCGETGIRSTEPARRVMGLARRVRDDAGLSAIFAEAGDARRRWSQLEGDGAQARFLAEVRAYLREFGDRCIEELKLETVPPRDDPASFLDLVASYERAGQFDGTTGREREKMVRATAEREVLPRLPIARRLVFRTVLARARRRVRDRENLRFERTRVFGAVRRIFRRLGQVMAERGALDGGRDVFYLTVSEVFDFFEGRLAADQARSRARERRAQFEAFAREPAPPSRFASDDDTPPPALAAAVAAPAAGGDLKGIGCCPGVVRAPVRVVRDPANPGTLTDHILVAERTDPGWTLLFPLAAGLLVERGSLLSHSAIVAREIGLPCVVGIPDLLRTLRDGEEVEMNGATGVVRRVSRPD